MPRCAGRRPGRLPAGSGDIQLGILRQPGHALAGVAVDAAPVGLVLGGQDAHEGGLAGAVGPHEADDGAFLEGGRNAAQHVVGAEVAGDGVEVEDDHGGE